MRHNTRSFARGRMGLFWMMVALAAAGPVFAPQPPPGQTQAKPASPQAKTPKPPDPKEQEKRKQREKERAEALRALLARYGVGSGSAVADVGAGGGRDTWTFATIVGDSGAVYAEEIAGNMVESLKKDAEKRKLPQVKPILGRGDDPCLPADAVDLAFMHLVYHHVTKPREMLRGIWKALKPGGYLVVIDQQRGTTREWVPRADRKDKHVWIGETIVVREAREEGFAFVGCADEKWVEKEPFVLVFQRPKESKEARGDPDPPLPLPVEKTAKLLLPRGQPYQRPVFIVLGQAGELIAPILQKSSGPGLEIVLEEWATQKDERPPLPPGVTLPAVLTKEGDPKLGPEPIDAVFFLDTYHLLFHGKTLLARLRERLSAGGCVYVLDRAAKGPLSRREASHRRQIAPEVVKAEMKEAGLFLQAEIPGPAPDRFLMVFGRTEPPK